MTDSPIAGQIIPVMAVLAYAVVLFKSRLNPKLVKVAAAVILLSGTFLYMYGFSLEHFAQGFITCFFRSLILAVKMFVYDVELLEIEHAQHEPLYLDLFYMVFYMAMLTSVSAIIMLFGKRARTLFSLFFRKRKYSHVFIGMNERSRLIAQGLDGDSVAILEFPDSEKKEEMSVRHAISHMPSNRQEYKLSKWITVLTARRNLVPNMDSGNPFDRIGLSGLKGLIDADTSFYILSQDNDENLDRLMALLEDPDLQSNTIHVAVSREGATRYYKTTLKRTGVHFIYPSSMAVVELMNNPLCHPVKHMTPALDANGNPAGAVTGEWGAMVIGFGETGQAVTKFLYEFSAAVLPDGRTIPSRIIVADERVESVKGHFIFENPDMDYGNVISFENCGTESGLFWDSLMANMDNLNCIAISMGSDAQNLNLACTIFMYAMKKRKGGLENLTILVRKTHTLKHERELVAKMNERAGREVMVCYGEYDRIFVPSMILSGKGNSINMNANRLANLIRDAYLRVGGNCTDSVEQGESFHERSKVRMELHQLISRANHLASVRMISTGRHELADAALENLARREHLRYRRYLEAHGYVFDVTDDDILKTNRQLCPWEELKPEDRRYHHDMVLAQLAVIREQSQSSDEPMNALDTSLS